MGHIATLRTGIGSHCAKTMGHIAQEQWVTLIKSNRSHCAKAMGHIAKRAMGQLLRKQWVTL
eukprot:12922219-Prorocentrum_lima.AAC.1